MPTCNRWPATGSSRPCCWPRRAAAAEIGAAGRLNLLHVIHDFLPRHHAGSEIQPFEDRYRPPHVIRGAARAGGILDRIGTSGGGLVYDAASPAELAAVLRGLMEDSGRLGVMGRSVPRVKSIVEDAQEWETRYSGLVAKPPG